jgi:hypothetical protein
LVYDSINVQGIDLGKNNYYIKFWIKNEICYLY